MEPSLPNQKQFSIAMITKTLQHHTTDLWPTLSSQPSFLSHVFILRKVLPLSSTKHSVIAVTWGVRGPKPLATCVLCHFHLSWLFQYLCDVCVCEQGSQPKTLGVLWWGREHILAETPPLKGKHKHEPSLSPAGVHTIPWPGSKAHIQI